MDGIWADFSLRGGVKQGCQRFLSFLAALPMI